MATVIPQRELRNDNAKILDRVAAGESFTVTRNGVPIADVVPHAATDRPPRFPRTADLRPQRPLAAGAAAAWVRDVRDLDDAIDQSVVDPWERARG